MMNTKTLAESYEGCLSRDWEKLLDILESGGRRVFIQAPYHDYPAKEAREITQVGIAYCQCENGKHVNYHIDGWIPILERGIIIKSIEKSVIGWFPTKEDEL